MISATRGWRRALGTTAALLLVAGVAAAGVMAGDERSGPSGNLSVGETVPAATFASVADATAEVSYRADALVHVVSPPGGAPIDDGPIDFRFVLEYDARSRLGHLRSVEPTVIKAEMVFGEGVVYFKADGFDGSGGRWTRADVPQSTGSTMPVASIDVRRMLDDLATSGGGTVTYEGRDRVRGDDVEHYRVTSTRDGAMSGDVWIDDDGRLRRLHLSDQRTTEVEVTVYDVGDDGIRVEAPADAVELGSDSAD